MITIRGMRDWGMSFRCDAAVSICDFLLFVSVCSRMQKRGPTNRVLWGKYSKPQDEGHNNNDLEIVVLYNKSVLEIFKLGFASFQCCFNISHNTLFVGILFYIPEQTLTESRKSKVPTTERQRNSGCAYDYCCYCYCCYPPLQ